MFLFHVTAPILKGLRRLAGGSLHSSVPPEQCVKRSADPEGVTDRSSVDSCDPFGVDGSVVAFTFRVE